MYVMTNAKGIVFHLSEDNKVPMCRQNEILLNNSWESFTSNSEATICQNCREKMYRKIRRSADKASHTNHG